MRFWTVFADLMDSVRGLTATVRECNAKLRENAGLDEQPEPKQVPAIEAPPAEEARPASKAGKGRNAA